jgi:hypothetical protein
MHRPQKTELQFSPLDGAFQGFFKRPFLASTAEIPNNRSGKIIKLSRDFDTPNLLDKATHTITIFL